MSNEQVEDIKADIEQVSEQLNGSELPSELVKLLRSHVEAIRRVLAHYNIYGNEGLHDAIKRILAELQMNHEIFEQHTNNDAVRAYKNLVGRVVQASNLLASAITIGGATWGVVGWLLGGP